MNKLIISLFLLAWTANTTYASSPTDKEIPLDETFEKLLNQFRKTSNDLNSLQQIFPIVEASCLKTILEDQEKTARLNIEINQLEKYSAILQQLHSLHAKKSTVVSTATQTDSPLLTHEYAQTLNHIPKTLY